MNPHKLYAKLCVCKQTCTSLSLDGVLTIGVCEPCHVKSHWVKGPFPTLKLRDSHFQKSCLLKNSCATSDGRSYIWFLESEGVFLKSQSLEQSSVPQTWNPKCILAPFLQLSSQWGSSLHPGTAIPWVPAAGAKAGCVAWHTVFAAPYAGAKKLPAQSLGFWNPVPELPGGEGEGG